MGVAVVVVAVLLLVLKMGDRSGGEDDGTGGGGEEMAMERRVRGARCRFCGESGTRGGSEEMVVRLPAFGVSEIDGACRLALLQSLLLPLLFQLRSGGGGNVYVYGDVLDEPGEVMALVTTEEIESSSMDSWEGCWASFKELMKANGDSRSVGSEPERLRCAAMDDDGAFACQHAW
jgi:hypothetical protein